MIDLFALEYQLTKLSEEARLTGCPWSVIRDIDTLIAKLPIIVEARERGNNSDGQ